MGLKPKLDKGPLAVLEALATGDKKLIDEAINFQRESFRAKYGCYPEECEPVPVSTTGDEPQDQVD